MSVLVRNTTSYPDREVRELVAWALEDRDVRRVAVTVRYSSSRHPRHASGRARSYWYPKRGEDRPQILVRLPRADVVPVDYEPYTRKRESGRSFPLADWREALVAIAAHEAEHVRQWDNGEHRHRRGSGRRRVDVELRCDLAAYRAWKRFRDSS